MEHNSLELWLKDHVPFFSWLMAVVSSRSSSRGPYIKPSIRPLNAPPESDLWLLILAPGQMEEQPGDPTGSQSLLISK